MPHDNKQEGLQYSDYLPHWETSDLATISGQLNFVQQLLAEMHADCGPDADSWSDLDKKFLREQLNLVVRYLDAELTDDSEIQRYEVLRDFVNLEPLPSQIQE